MLFCKTCHAEVHKRFSANCCDMATSRGGELEHGEFVVVIPLFGAVLYAQQAPLELTVDQAVQLALQNSKADVP